MKFFSLLVLFFITSLIYSQEWEESYMFGDACYEYAHDIEVDGNGNKYLLVEYSDTLNFNGTKIPNYYENIGCLRNEGIKPTTALIKVDKNDNVLWYKRYAVNIDNCCGDNHRYLELRDDKIVFTFDYSRFVETIIDGDTIPLYNGINGPYFNDIFYILWYDVNGNEISRSTLNGEFGQMLIKGIGDSNDIYLKLERGNDDTTLFINGSNLNEYDKITKVIKYVKGEGMILDSTGRVKQHFFESERNVFSPFQAIDNVFPSTSGNVYREGGFHQEYKDQDGNVVLSSPQYEFFHRCISEYDSQGKLLWASDYLNSEGSGALFKIDQLKSSVKDSIIVLAGWLKMKDSVRFGQETLYKRGDDDKRAFVLCTDLRGNPKWIHTISGERDQNVVKRVEINDDGYVFVGGEFGRGDLSVDDSIINTNGFEGEASFVAKFSRDGRMSYIKSIGVGGTFLHNRFGDIAVNNEGLHYLGTHNVTFRPTLDWGAQTIQNQSGITNLKYLSATYARLQDCNTEIKQSGNQLSIEEGDSYQWYKGDVKLIGATNSTLNLSVSGNYWAEVFWSNGCYVKTHDKKASVVTSIVSSVENVDNVNVYPNPAKELVHIESDSEISEVKLINAQGMMLLELSPYNTSYVMNVSEFPSGVYYVTLKSENSVFTQKIIKK